MNKTSFLLFIILFSCGNKELPDHTAKQYNYKKNTTKNIYYLNYDLSGDFDIVINGVSLTRNRKEGVMMNYEYLNPYISKSGNQTITLSLKPLDNTSKLSPNILNEIKLELYQSINNTEAPLKKNQTLKLPQYKVAQDSIIYTWTFDAEVPFEINSLSNAEDLTKEDPHKLLQDVVAEYERIQKLINEGNITEYMEVYKNSRKREMLSMYYDEAKQKEYLAGLEKRALSSKGFMQPISDYKILIHPNKKVVSLVNSEGKTPLYSTDDNGKRKTYGLQIYRSLKTGKLEVY